MEWPMFWQKTMLLNTLFWLPPTLVGALGLGIELCTLLGTPLEVDAPIRLKMKSINMNDYGNHAWH
jgi:hypothetical protein